MGLPISNKWWVIIPIVLTIYEYGVTGIIYVLTALFAFIIGFFFLNCDLSVKMRSIRCSLLRGRPEIATKLKRSASSSKEKYVSGCPALDSVLNEVFDLLIRDYIHSWYRTITMDETFPQEVRKIMQKVAIDLTRQCRKVRWIPYVTEELPDDFASHIRLYLKTLNRGCSKSKPDIEKIFFDLEADMEKTICREHTCTNKEEEKIHLQHLSDMLLCIVLPAEEFNNKPLRYLIREIIVNSLLLPTIDLISDPDFINQYIIWICQEKSFTSEYFIQTLRMSDSAEEMAAVIDKVSAFTKRMRGRDTGGDDDAKIKAEIASLTYVEKLCTLRMKQIKEGNLDMTDSLSLYQLPPGQNLYNMSFQEMLGTDVAVGTFLDFLTMLDSQHYLNMLLNIEGYRCTARHILGDNDLPNSGDFMLFSSGGSSSSSDEEVRSLALNMLLDFKEKLFSVAEARHNTATPPPSTSTSTPATLSNESNQIDQSVRKTLHRISMEPPSSCVFDELREQLLDILQEDRFYGEFKRSSNYVQLLAELDLLREGNQISEDDILFDKDDLKIARNFLDEDVDFKSKRLSSPADFLTAHITKTETIKSDMTPYTLYTITVSKSGAMLASFMTEGASWETHRRYSHFDELHNLIIQECGKLPQLRLPVKKAFNNMTKEFLDKRRKELADYLQTVLAPDFITKYPSVKVLVYDFLQAGPWERKKHLPRQTPSSLRSMSNSLMSMPDNFRDGFSRIMSGTPAPPALPRASSPSISSKSSNEEGSESGKVANGLDQADVDNIPMRILFILMDEVFNLREKNQFVRRGILNIQRKIVKTLFGLRVNNMIKETASRLMSAAHLAELITQLKEKWWPGGELAPPQPPRDLLTKMRTRIVCLTKMLGSVTDSGMSQFLGNETTRRGVHRVFNLFQHDTLNRRLVYVIFEGALRQIFPNNNINNFFQTEHCPNKQGRICKEGNGDSCHSPQKSISLQSSAME